MIDYKDKIAAGIQKAIGIEIQDLKSFIELPPSQEMGDFSFPCFRLAKELKKAPPAIAQEINEKMTVDTDLFEKVDVTGGYLNFFVNKETMATEVLQDVDTNQQNYGASAIGEGKNIIVEE